MLKKILLASSDALVLETLIPLIEEGRVYVYRLAERFDQLQAILKDESDFFVALVDATLLDDQSGASIHLSLSYNIPTIALIGELASELKKELTNLAIVDYVSKGSKDEIHRALNLAEDLIHYKNKKVLIVHSNKTIEMYLIAFFNQILFQPVVAHTIDEALAILASDEMISIIVVNNEHAQMKGSEFVKLIRLDAKISKHAYNKDVIVFGITSSESDAVRSDFIKNGANDILKVPLSKEEFNAKISNIMRLTSQTKQLRSQMHLINKYVISSQTDIYGTITNVSEAFERISGFVKEELVGKPHSTVSHPERDSSIFKGLWQTIKRGETWHGEIKNRTKSGEAFWLRINISPDYEEGALIGYSAISEDITAQKELEVLSKNLEHRVHTALEENERQSQQMMHQSRLAQMGEMISMIAHQWRQPLASITAVCGTMSLDIMMNNYNEKAFEDQLNRINELAQHLSSTINDFRGFFRDSKELTLSNWDRMIKESLTIIGPVLDTQSIKTVRDFEAKDDFLTFPNEIKQVILNIIKNAEEVLRDRESSDSEITFRSFESTAMTVLCIEDSGGGIPEEILNKVFDPYFSTKEKKGGTGLGLYMSKTIVEEHCKGELRVTNGEKGACFEIALPKMLDKSSL